MRIAQAPGIGADRIQRLDHRALQAAQQPLWGLPAFRRAAYRLRQQPQCVRVHHAPVILDMCHRQIGRRQTHAFDGFAQRVPGAKAFVNVDADDATHGLVETEYR